MARKRGNQKSPKKTASVKSTPKQKGGKRSAESLAEPDYEGLTVQKLKQLCSEQGLETKGKKTDLINRLKNKGDDEAPPTKVAKLQKQNTLEKAAAAIVSAGTGKRKTFKPDKQCTLANKADCQVYKDYDCMLNRTDISQKNNKNKYYIIQVLTSGGNYYAWNRWGRVGDPPGCFHGQKLHGPFKGFEGAVKSFESKFWEKSRTKWEDKDKEGYKPVKGKYTLIEMGEEDEDEPVKISVAEGKLAITAPCKLDKHTLGLVKFIFDTDMFKKAMVQLSFDVKKMPLGKLSKVQIAKGFEVLSEIRDAINKNQKSKLSELSGNFYTVIPHDFGWKKPSVINSLAEVREKMDNLLVLGDIELAQALQKNPDTKKIKAKAGDLAPHPLDVSYGLLDCDLDLIPEGSAHFKTIQKYMEATRGYCIKKIRNIWQMNRRPEKTITSDDPSLVKPPSGFDCVVARGRTEPNPKDDVSMTLEGKKVFVPQGKPIQQGQYGSSSFTQSEYLVYKEDQVRMRYLLQLEWSY